MAQEASRPQRKRSAVSYAETDEVVSDLSDYDSDFEKTTKRRGKEPPKKVSLMAVLLPVVHTDILQHRNVKFAAALH